MRNQFLRFALTIGVVCCLAAFVGCGKNDGLCTVEGTVTLDGAPLADGTINFGPMAGASGTATGAKIVNGKYSARASEGEMVVNIHSQKKETTRDEDGRESLNLTELIPAKYNQESELKASIGPGKNVCNFDLTSDSSDK